MTLKTIELVNQTGNTTTIEINPNHVVFLSEVELSTQVVGNTKKGTSIGLSNGMVLNSPTSKEDIKKLLGD